MSMLDSSDHNQNISIPLDKHTTQAIKAWWGHELTLFAGFVFNFSKILRDSDLEARAAILPVTCAISRVEQLQRGLVMMFALMADCVCAANSFIW